MILFTILLTLLASSSADVSSPSNTSPPQALAQPKKDPHPHAHPDGHERKLIYHSPDWDPAKMMPLVIERQHQTTKHRHSKAHKTNQDQSKAPQTSHEPIGPALPEDHNPSAQAKDLSPSSPVTTPNRIRKFQLREFLARPWNGVCHADTIPHDGDLNASLGSCPLTRPSGMEGEECHGRGHPPQSQPCGCGCNCNCQDVFFRYSGNILPSIGPGGVFNYYTTNTSYVANDGRIATIDGALQVNSLLFTKTSTDIADHSKYILLTNQNFSLPTKGSISFSANVKGRTFGVQTQPFGNQVTNPGTDPRLANVAFFVTDISGGFVFGFLLTNGVIYAIYERSTLVTPLWGDYAAFTQIRPLGNTSPDQFQRLSLVFNSSQQSVGWIVNDQLRFTLQNLGSRISNSYTGVDNGGIQESYWPRAVAVGFGTGDYLNAYQSCYQTVPAADGGRICKYPPNEMGLVYLEAYSRQFKPRAVPESATFVSDGTDPRYRLFGQGAVLWIKDLAVGYCQVPFFYRKVHREEVCDAVKGPHDVSCKPMSPPSD